MIWNHYKAFTRDDFDFQGTPMCFPISIHRKKVHFPVESVLDFCLFLPHENAKLKVHPGTMSKEKHSVHQSTKVIDKQEDRYILHSRDGRVLSEKKEAFRVQFEPLDPVDPFEP
ncbi:MAG: hypothetical protein IJE78_03710 [Bacteroidaceae bacterium]|nr:hypothetical protein [Bacteroidaceae bacterium]